MVQNDPVLTNTFFMTKHKSKRPIFDTFRPESSYLCAKLTYFRPEITPCSAQRQHEIHTERPV